MLPLCVARSTKVLVWICACVRAPSCTMAPRPRDAKFCVEYPSCTIGPLLQIQFSLDVDPSRLPLSFPGYQTCAAEVRAIEGDEARAEATRNIAFACLVRAGFPWDAETSRLCTRKLDFRDKKKKTPTAVYDAPHFVDAPGTGAFPRARATLRPRAARASTV